MTNPDGTCIDPLDCNGCGTCADKPLNITVPLCTSDYELFRSVIEQGIDSHLEGFTESSFEEKMVDGQPRLVMSFVGKDIPILIRRLEELGEDGNEEAEGWANDIQYLQLEKD